MHINIQLDPETKAIYMEVTINSLNAPMFVYFAPHEFHEARAYIADLLPGTNVYVDREDADEGDSPDRA